MTVYFKKWIHESYNLYYIIFLLQFITSSISLEYYFSITRSIIDYSDSIFLKFFLFLCLYSYGYLIPLALDRILNGPWLKKTDLFFYIFIFTAVTVPALDSSLIIPAKTFLNFSYLPASPLWIKKVTDNFLQILILTIPALIVWISFHRKNNVTLYGFTRKYFSFKPYFIFVLIMLIPVFAVSFLDDFRISYPRLRPFFFRSGDEIPHSIQMIIFQLIYGIAFAATEFFYRGFLVIAPLSYLGMRGVLPAASLYCFIHFQKPLIETISSFPGGFILGVIAAGSLSIYGGIIAHLGIAWSMELAGHFQILTRGDLLIQTLLKSKAK